MATDGLTLLLTMVGPPAAMLAAGVSTRYGVRWHFASAAMLASMIAGVLVLRAAVQQAYATLGVSEGHGTLATAFLLGFLWLVVAAIACVIMVRGRHRRSHSNSSKLS
jgi:Na+/melibiose symporter-like transporter